MEYSTHTFGNGLRLIHAWNNSPVTYCGYAIDAGTRDEDEEYPGIAHLVEHLIFKGTQKRHAWHILNRMENVGGDLNAYTNKEETVVYSTFLTEHLPRAVELLTDIVFHSTFPQREMDKEVEVVIDEIDCYEDSPSDLIFDDFEEMLFPSHPLGRNILGKPDKLRLYKSKDVLSFTTRYYVPCNMVFFCQGSTPFQKVVRLLEKAMADVPARNLIKERTAPIPGKPYSHTVHRDTHQAHVITGCMGYNSDNPRRSALYLLNNILGGPGMNSRLNVSLREKRGLVYNVEANLSSYTDTGIFSIYFGCDARQVDHCIELTRKELQKLCEKPMNDMQLRAAKKQIIGQLGVAGDNFENTALDMGKLFLHYGRYEKLDTVVKRIDSLTTKELWEVSNELFSQDNFWTLIYQ